MAVKIKNTRDVGTDGVKALVYGKAGIGKTTLMSTAENPIILSCESGLLALADIDVPYIEIETINDAYEAYEYLTEDPQGMKFKTIALDSISEIAEVMLTKLKKESKDARQAYGELADEMASFIRAFRDLKGRNVIFSAKQVRITDDDTGITSYFAAMPGKNLLNSLPFFFDEVFYMTLANDADGEPQRVIKTSSEFGHDAKDRSGKLNAIERPDLGYIFSKIRGEVKEPTEEETTQTLEEQEVEDRNETTSYEDFQSE